MSQEATVTYRGFLDMQICVPVDWTDTQAVEFAEKENPCGTRHSWRIRTADARVPDYKTRVKCEHASRPNFVHLMLDA